MQLVEDIFGRIRRRPGNFFQGLKKGIHALVEELGGKKGAALCSPLQCTQFARVHLAQQVGRETQRGKQQAKAKRVGE